jgi:hypothetical protein
MNLLPHSHHDMKRLNQSFMPGLHEALEASWDRQTAYGTIEQAGNSALGHVDLEQWCILG